MKYQIPKTFMGKPVEGAMKRVLEGTSDSQNTNQNPITQNSGTINLRNPEDYILLPGKVYGDRHYVSMLVSMYKLGVSPEVEQANMHLGYQLANSAKESNGRDFIGNMNWNQALSTNLYLGGCTLEPRRFADFLLLLKSGNAVDGTGRKVPESKLTEILDEISKVRSPYRAEWLDADFKYLDQNLKPVDSANPNGRLFIHSAHDLGSNGLVPINRDLLENCLMTKGSRINLSTMNNQGMPNQEGNDFLYWCPDKDNKSVARFVAVSDRASLCCDWYPTYASSSLGVRHCVPKARAQN